MNYLTYVRPVFEILSLLGVTTTSTAPHLGVPFSPVAYCLQP